MRRSFRPAAWVAGALAASAACSPAWAQLPIGPRPTIIENARILTMDGQTIERGSILLRGDRIAAVGVDLEVPPRARRVDASGLTITPGLIDAHSALALTADGRGQGSGLLRATDAIDRYATYDVNEALRRGIVAAYVPARSRPGLSGAGAIVRLTGSGLEILDDDAGLCINLGSDEGAVARLGVFDGVRSKFREAKEYRESLEIYAEELEDYEKKVKERLEKFEAEEKKKKEGGESGDKPAGAQASKPEEIKKPREPRKNLELEAVLRALDGKTPVRVLADRSEDILNALELAGEFGLKTLIIEGGAEAHLIADELAAADVRVVLAPAIDTVSRGEGARRRASADAGRALWEAGVSWTVSSGGASRAAVSALLPIAQTMAGASGADADHALHLITVDAASILGLDDLGRIRRGMRADFVMWTGDPGDPASQVHTVVVGGEVAYRSPQAAEGGQ